MSHVILTEIARLGMELVAGNGERFVITPDEFKYYWRKVREKTSSSISKLHIGQYKAACQCNFLSRKITVVDRCGIPPKRWGSGLQVMLEKIAGVALVNKLRAIS